MERELTLMSAEEGGFVVLIHGGFQHAGPRILFGGTLAEALEFMRERLSRKSASAA